MERYGRCRQVGQFLLACSIFIHAFLKECGEIFLVARRWPFFPLSPHDGIMIGIITAALTAAGRVLVWAW